LAPFEGARCDSGQRPGKGSPGRVRGPKPGKQKAGNATFPAKRATDPPDSATFRGPPGPKAGKSRKTQKLHWYSERVFRFSAPLGPKREPGGARKPEPREHPGPGPGRKGPKGPEKGRKPRKQPRTEQKDQAGFFSVLGPLGPGKQAFLACFGPKGPKQARAGGPDWLVGGFWAGEAGQSQKGPKGPKTGQKQAKTGKSGQNDPQGPYWGPLGPPEAAFWPGGPENRETREPAPWAGRQKPAGFTAKKASFWGPRGAVLGPKAPKNKKPASQPTQDLGPEGPGKEAEKKPKRGPKTGQKRPPKPPFWGTKGGGGRRAPGPGSPPI